MPLYAGFVDVGFLRAEGARQLKAPVSGMRPNAAGLVEWLRHLEIPELVGQEFLRAYWYDGAWDPSHQQHAGQRAYLDAVASNAGVQLRLGHIAERPNRLERPVTAAIRNAAQAVGSDPQRLLDEFHARWTFYPERVQKGVDALMTLDLVRLAQRGAYSTAVLVSGDRDLAEPVRAAQDVGCRVVVAVPEKAGVAKELRQLADVFLQLDDTEVGRLLSRRGT